MPTTTSQELKRQVICTSTHVYTVLMCTLYLCVHCTYVYTVLMCTLYLCVHCTYVYTVLSCVHCTFSQAEVWKGKRLVCMANHIPSLSTSVWYGHDEVGSPEVIHMSSRMLTPLPLPPASRCMHVPMTHHPLMGVVTCCKRSSI